MAISSRKKEATGERDQTVKGLENIGEVKKKGKQEKNKKKGKKEMNRERGKKKRRQTRIW